MLLFFLYCIISLHLTEAIISVTVFFIHTIKFLKLRIKITYNVAIDT